MEIDEDNNGVPDGWYYSNPDFWARNTEGKPFNSFSLNGGKYTWEEGAIDGKKCIAVDCRQEKKWGEWDTIAHDIRPHTDYILSFLTKRTGGYPQVLAFGKYKCTLFKNEDTQNAYQPEGWIRFYVRINSGKYSGNCRLGLLTEDSSEKNWYDDVKLVAVDEGYYRIELKKIEKVLSKLSLPKYSNRIETIRQELNKIDTFSSRKCVELGKEISSLKEDTFQKITQLLIEKSNKIHTRGDTDYAVLIDSSMVKIFKDGEGSSFTVDRNVYLSLAQNEYEGFQLTLLPIKKSLQEIQIQCTDLVNTKQRTVIKKENINSYVVGYIKTEKPQYPVKRIGWWPDQLLEKKQFDIEKDTFQPIWIKIHVSSGTPPGLYNGKIKIKPANSHFTVLNLYVRVWDFTLPVESHIKTSFDFSRQPYKAYYGFSDGELKDKFKKAYSFLLDNRISCEWWPNGELLLSEVEDLQYYLNKGLSATTVGWQFYDETTWQRLEKRMLKRWNDTKAELKKLNAMDKVYGFGAGCDEVPPGAPEYDKAIRTFKQIKQVAPELPICSTANFPEKFRKDWVGLVDIWIPVIQAYDQYKEDFEKRRKAGDEIWIYFVWATAPYPTILLEGPAIDMRIVPWMAWKYDIKGISNWAINFWNANIYDVFGGGKEFENKWPARPWSPHCGKSMDRYNGNPLHNGCGVLVYPGKDGKLLSSIRFENLRDGLEDYEYLYLLSEKLKKVKNKCKNNKKLIERAEDLLKINPFLVESIHHYTKQGEILLDIRKKIAECIEEIQQEMRNIE